MEKRLLQSFFFLFISSNIFAQAELGLNSSKMKWRQINTDKIRLVFPEELGPKANRTASLLHYLYDSAYGSIGEKRQKVTVILQNQNTIPNGFVSLSPFRSEFYMNSPQLGILGSGDWVDLLAVHEYRHVQQSTNSRRGVSKFISWIFGQNGWAFMRAMAMPRWFAEGDAILAETALSNAGRGRLPDFHREYRALWRAGKNYNYEKASAGSLKDYVPSHYHLGYYMTAYARRHYGEEIWSEVFENAAKYKGIFFPLSRNLKKRTGLSTPKLYKKTMAEMDSFWQAQKAEMKIVKYTPINTPEKAVFTDYSNPKFLDENTVIAQKSSFREIDQFFKIDLKGNEKFLTNAGFNTLFNKWHATKNGKIAWAEIAYHKRWAGTTFSNIKIYEIDTKVKTKLTKESNYFSVDLSADASKIVAVAYQDSVKYNLSILSASSGNVLQTFPNPEGYLYTYPTWSEDGTSIYTVIQKDNRNVLAKVDVEAGTTQLLTPWLIEQMLRPFQRGDFVYFSAAFSKIQNIYAVNLNDQVLYQVTFSEEDVFTADISPSGEQMVFSAFTSMGEKLYLTEVNPVNWEKLESFPIPKYLHADILTEQEGGELLDDLQIQDFEQTPFRKLGNLINIHSMQPYLTHPNYRLELQSDNTFTTLSAIAGVNYNANGENLSYYGTVEYGEFFPVFDVTVTSSNERERAGFYIDEEITEADTTIFGNSYLRNWNENDVSVGVTLPFNIMQGVHFGDLTVSARYHFLSIDNAPTNFRFDQEIQERNGSFNAISLETEFSRFRMKAPRQVNPRFGQYFRLQYNATTGSDINKGSALLLNGALYWPGLFKTHSFFVTGGYRSEAFNNNYLFRDNFFYARGYDTQLLYDRISRLSFNYGFPLLYPDLPVGPFAFIKQLNLNLFYDVAVAEVDEIFAAESLNNTSFDNLRGSIESSSSTYRSLGAELTANFRAFRLLDVELGARYSRLLDPLSNRNENQFDFLVLRIGQ